MSSLLSLLRSLKSVLIRLTLFIAPRQTSVTAQMIRRPVIIGSSFWLTEFLNHFLKCEISRTLLLYVQTVNITGERPAYIGWETVVVSADMFGNWTKFSDVNIVHERNEWGTLFSTQQERRYRKVVFPFQNNSWHYVKNLLREWTETYSECGKWS